jgi:hypothetical protein
LSIGLGELELELAADPNSFRATEFQPRRSYLSATPVASDVLSEDVSDAAARDPTIRIWPGTRGGPGTRPDLTPQKSPPNAPRLSRLLQRSRFRATEVPGQLVGQLCGNLRRRILARQGTVMVQVCGLFLRKSHSAWLDCPRVAANRGPSSFHHAASPRIELWMTRFSPILLQPQPGTDRSALWRVFVREFSRLPGASGIISHHDSIEQLPSRLGRPSRDY